MTDKLKKAYISGPYSAPTPWETEINIMAARIIAAELFRRGYSVFCPHSNSSHMDGVVDYDHFIQADLEWVDICDELYVFGDWKQSPGSVKSPSELLYHSAFSSAITNAQTFLSVWLSLVAK